MELSTTNGHITIDYLFIYQSHLFSLLVQFVHCKALLAHIVNGLFLHKVKVGFQMDGFCGFGPYRGCEFCFETPS